MATEADDVPDPTSVLKREVEGKEMTSELSNITVSEGPQEEKRKIESWLSQPPEMMEFLGKTGTEEVGDDDEVAETNVINKGNGETNEGDVFSKSLSVTDEKTERFTEHSGMTLEGEKSTASIDPVGIEMNPEMIRPTIDKDRKNKHGSSLLDAPVEETTSEKAGPDVGEFVEENMSLSSKEASQEAVELTEKINDSTSNEDVFFHEVDNLETSDKESESGMKDIVKESQQEAEHKNEILENIATADSDQSKTSKLDEIDDKKNDVSFGQTLDSLEDNFVVEEQEKTETSTHEEQSGHSHMQKTEREAPADSKEIETEGATKYAEVITNIEEQRPAGSPEEIAGEEQKDETVISYDINKNETQENIATVDSDEKTRSAEIEIPNKSGSDSWITHPPIEEEVQVVGEKQDEVSMSESGDSREAIQIPSEEEKHVNETAEATKSPENKILEHTATEVTSTSEMDINTEEGCELKSEEALKEINPEDNMEEESKEQIEKVSDTEFLVQRKSDDNERSTIEEDIPVKNETPLFSGEEEYRQDQEEKVGSNSFLEEIKETDSGDQSYITSDETNTLNEQIINQEVCEDTKIVDRAEDTEKEMKNDENTDTDFSPEPMGESTIKCSEGNEAEAKKHRAEASEQYDTCGESAALEENAKTDLPSSHVQEEEVEESLTENRREAIISDKEVSNSNVKCIERDFEATHSTMESSGKDLKDEEEENEVLNAQSIMGSSEEETAQESNSNLVQSSSVPEIIEKEVNRELLEKEESKDTVEVEEARLTEVEPENSIQVDNSNLMSEAKGQVTTETSEMRSNDIDVIAESSEISIVGDNKTMEIPTERKDAADESTEKTQPEGKSETCDESSKLEDQGEIATVETSLEYKPDQELLESSTMPLEAHNLITEVNETTGEAPDKVKTLSDKEETPLVAETTEEHVAKKEDESLLEENDTNMGSIDIGKESTIDDSLHAPLELNSGKSGTESDVEILKGVNAGEAANGSDSGKLETSYDERSSYKEVETEKSEYEEAVNEASQGIEVGGGRIETEKTIEEQADTAMHFEGSSKESVEMEKGTVEFESEALSCEGSETPTISAQTVKKIDVEDKELASELPNVTANEVPTQEKRNTESWLSQPSQTPEILETECMQVAPNFEVGNVNVVDKGNVGTTESESFLKSTSVDDGKLSGFQDEEEKAKTIKDEDVIVEASYGQDGGVGIQSPELTEGSNRDVEIPNEVLNEENIENITSTETTSVERDLKETSFKGEDKKSNALEMDPEATQPSTDIEDEKNKVEEMPCHGVKDVCVSTETDKPTESNVGATDRLGSSLVAAPIEETRSTKAGLDVRKNLEENSSMACEDESEETGTLREKIKDDASIEDEVQNQNLESSFVKKVEDFEISKEESETGMKDTDKEKQNEAENQNNTLDNTATADRSLSTEGEDVENPERKSHISDMLPEESMTREGEDVTPPEALAMECKPEVMVVPGEDSVVVEEQKTTETSKHEEHSEQSLKENAEPANENAGSPMVVASEEFEATSLNDHAEIITNIEEESPVGNPEEILGERKNEINNKQISEAESQSALDLDNNTRSAEIPDNSGDEVCVTHPPMEETVLEGGEKQVSMLQSVDQVHEASAPEFPKDEEKNASDSNEASKSPDSECSISEQTSAEGEVNIETTRSMEEIPVGSQEEIHGQPRKDETMTADYVNNKETPEAKNLSTADLYSTTPSVEGTFLEEGEKKNDVSVLESGNQVSEASEVPREEERDGDGTYEAIKSPEINILERTSNEGALNMEATSTRSAANITLEKGIELISEDELKELNSEENKEEVTKQIEKPAVADFQIPTKNDDEENSTIKEESLVRNNTPTCTAEGEYHHDQEDEVMPNRSKEVLPALDSREQSLSTSNEIKIIDDQIMNEEASNVHGSHGTAPASTTTDECSASDIPSSSIGEEKVEERMNDDIGDETESEIEVSNSTAECIEQTFDAMCSTEKREDRTLKHEESIKESPSEQTTQEGRNLDITENYSSVPDIGGEEVKEEVLEKEDTNVPVAAEETSLTQTEGENVKTVDSSDLVVEEKCLVPTEISEGSNPVTRTAETSILGEDNDVEVPTAREVATVETSLDDVSEQMLQASSIQKSEEHNLVSPEGETTGEAPEKDSTFYEKAETPLAEETTEDEITEIEDESLHPMKDSNMGSIKKENDYAAVEDRELYTPPEQNIEESTFESDVEPLRNAKSETVEELKSSEKDNPEYETAISGTSEGVETCGGYMDSEKAILEQEDSAKNLEGSSMEGNEIEKASVEFEAETHSSETSEVKSISILKEEDQNINVVEHDETAAESMAKDEDNRRFTETNSTNSEEERQDDENQTIASTDEQINRKDIQEGKREMNEEMEPKFDTQDKISGTQDAILTEKVSTEIESTSERETIKEQNTEEESCTKELHTSPAADGTINEVSTVLESPSESEIIEGQITEEESCTKELHTIKLADETVDEVRDLDLTPIQSLEATASNKNDEMMRSEATQKEVNETEDAFSTEEVSRETSSAMDEVTCPDLTAIHSLEATASNNITETMESKTAQDLNEESLEDETKNIEMPVDVSSLVSEGSEEKMKGEKIEDMESGNEETDIASTVATDLSSLGEVQLNDEPVKAIDASSDADAGEQKLEETAEKSDANDVEVEVTKIPDSVVQTEDQAVKEIHETRTSLNAIDADTQEIEQQVREVPEVLLKPSNQHGDEARDEEIIPGQASQVEKTEEQLQVPSTGLLSEEQESETTTRIEKGGTNEDAMEEAKMRQAEVSMIREELETTSEGEGIGNQVQGEEKGVQDFAEELNADSSRDNAILTKMSTQEVLETNHGGEDTDEPVKAIVTSSDTGSLQTTETSDASQQELEEKSSMVSPFPVEEHEKSENISVNVDNSGACDVEEKEFEIHGDVPEGKDQKVQEIQGTGASLAVEEAHTNETANQNREAPEGFSEAINQGVEAPGEDEIIAPTVAMEVTNLGEVQLNEHVETLDANSGAKNLDTIKTADASQQNAEFDNMKLEETCIMASQPPIHEHEKVDEENIPPEKSEEKYIELEETKIPERVPQYQDQAVKDIHETGTSLDVGDSDTNEIEKPISEVAQALMEPKNQCVDTARDDEITSVPILRGEKLEEQLQAPSSGLLSNEQERETTTENEKGSTYKDAIEGTPVLQAEIREELETTSEGKGTENQVQAEEKRVQDWSKVYSPEELDTKSSEDNATMIPKMSREEVLETNPGGHDTDEHVKALDTSSDTESLQTTQTPNASQQEFEETHSMVSQLPVHEYEKPDDQNVTAEKSDAYNVEVKEIDLTGVVPESKDQRVNEIHEVGTHVEDTQTNEMETQVREVREALSEDVSQSVETISGDEIIAPSEATKVKTLGELQVNDEHVEAPDTIKTGDGSQQDAQFDSVKHEETSTTVVQLPIHEDEKEESESRPIEKSDANDVEVKEAEVHDTVPKSEDQAVKEIHETSRSLTVAGADTNEIEKQIRVPEALSEPINPYFDTSRDDEMTPVQTLQAEKTDEQLQVPSSGLFSKEEDGETSTEIEKGSTDKDGTEVGNLELQENSGLIEEKSDADEVGLIETKTLDAVSESKDQVFEVVHDVGTIRAAEDTETDKVEEELKEVTEKVPDPGYKGGDVATDDENLNHPLPVDKLEEQIQLSSSSYESTKKDATELDKSELEEATGMLSKLPTTEHGTRHLGTTIEKSEADEIQVEEAKTSEAIFESEGDGFEEIKEIGSSLPVEKTCTDEVKEETKAVPETIFEPNYEGAQTAIEVETAINQTLTPQGVEQLQEPKSTTEKPCLQDKGLKDLEVSNLELIVQDSQDISAEEENTGLKKSSTDAPSEFEESPIQGSSQEASTDEDIVYLKNSNKDADYLPPRYPTVTELSTEDKGGKSEEASNLKFEKNGKVLLESVSTINSLEAPVTTEGIEVKEEYPLETTTELGDGENHCEETTEEEAIEKHISKEKVTKEIRTMEETQGSRNFDPVSLGEETATKTNQEGILMAENYPGERANAIFEASRNEVQHEMVFEESQEAGADKSTEEEVTADDDKGPLQLSVGDEIANVTPPEEAKDGQNIKKIPNESELKSHGDETDSTDAATEAAAQIKELKSSEAMLVSHEVERIGDNAEETVISKDRKLQNTAPDVPPEADAAAEKAPDGQELQTFDDFCEPALEGPPHGFTEPFEHKKEIVNTGTIDSESLMDTEKPEHTFFEPVCEGTSGTEDLDLTNKDGSNKPSISSATATSQETIADEESEKAVDAKQHAFMSDEPTAEPASIPEEGFQLEENTMDKEAVELSALGDKRKPDEAKIQTITAIEDEETQQENDGLPHIEDSEKEVSHKKVLMNIPEDVQGPEETSLAMPHEQIASKTDPSESIECTNPTASKDAPVMQDNAAEKIFQNIEVEDLNAGRDLGSEPEAKGMECAEENRMGEKSEEITEDSQKIESAKMSSTDLLQRSTKRNSEVVEDLTEERELMGNKEEPQNATAETVQAEEAEVHETKDEEEEVDEHKREDSGSDAPVMVEASRDMDVKTAHKKSHHNILSGVGSKVKHSLAKVRKAITGKSSHPKPTSPK